MLHQQGPPSANDHLALVQRLLLRPSVAAQIISCYRPVLLTVLSLLVEGQLSGVGSQVDDGRGVSVALVTALQLAAHTHRVVLKYFRYAPAPFEYILRGPGGQTHAQEPDAERPSDAQLARATLHALQGSPQLRLLWNQGGMYKLLSHQDADVRWCAVQCVALLVPLSDASTRQLSRQLFQPAEDLACALRWREACMALQVELAAADGDDEMDMEADEAFEGSNEDAGKLAVAAGYVNVCGILLPHRDAPPETHASSRLVKTATAQRTLEAAALALCQGQPLLLEGPPGCGKSAVLEELARLTGNHDMVRIHVDGQMDGKSLLGAYVCTAVPGEFVWQPGPLTKAVAEGKWLLIEDLNLAPPDVLAALVPLLESRTLHLPQRAQTTAAAPGFQLLASITCAPGGGSAGAYGSSQGVREVLGGLWATVAVEPPSEAEQQSILAAVHPVLRPLLPSAMAVLHLIRRASGQQSQPDGDRQTSISASMEAAGLRSGDTALHVGRHFSLRDLFKWCGRMQSIHGLLLARALRGAQYESGDGVDDPAALPLAVREAAFVESADVFAAMIAKREARVHLLAALAALWGLQFDHVQQHTDLQKPSLVAHATDVAVGRALLPISAGVSTHKQAAFNSSFARTGHAMRTMEAMAVALQQCEPVLVVGETGTGKTTMVQQIAQQVGVKLVVLNLSQQTDSSDLLGGFKPVEPRDALLPLLEHFQGLVRRTWTRGDNEEFLGRVAKYAQRRKWGGLVKAFRTAAEKVAAAVTPEASPRNGGTLARTKSRSKFKSKLAVQDGPEAAEQDEGGQAAKRKKPFSDAIREEWRRFGAELDSAERAAEVAEGGFAFAFLEGQLIKAVRNGWWLLLDEINLAPPEALECIAGLLENDTATITLSERGDAHALPRHPSFRLLAAMNPATDAGKRDLPSALRNRFTELWVAEPSAREDLQALVFAYLQGATPSPPVDSVVDFYLAAKHEADTMLQDPAGQKPSYSLRTLSRALEYARPALPVYGLQRALYDGCAMSFMTQLQPAQAAIMEGLLRKHILGGAKSIKGLMRAPAEPPGGRHVLFEHFWVELGCLPLPQEGATSGVGGGQFVMTPSVMQHLRNLARAVLLRRYPILLQGPTSSGKTSLVAHLAEQTGHKFIRINNHEQTDLQEYLGSYVTDETGRLVYREGALVEAVRKGYWIVLDELNLAPTEVLEALNRLLDDNRELFVPELQETVTPHSHFMLFATQNPPGIYAGRKVLSRAFRSRFLELHVDDIPDSELTTILEKRCDIAPTYASKLVNAMRELQRQRQSSNVFAGKHGFITPRDLFKWAGRGAVGYQQLAEDGYLLLAERLRNAEERFVVQAVLESVMKVKLDMDELYTREGDAPVQRLQAALSAREENGSADTQALKNALRGVVWTPSMRRMYTVLDRCLRHAEPALLVGETGTGKTTVCQLLALMRGQRLHIVNCNQHTEASDFLGGFRPSRDREASLLRFNAAFTTFNASPLLAQHSLGQLLDPKTSLGPDLMATATAAHQLVASLKKGVKAGKAGAASSAQQLEELKAAAAEMQSAAAAARAPFAWVDGPLVTAMRQGDIILIDELNLAEDAVLERLNSVLEPGRSLTLAEKGGGGAEVVVAAKGFRLVATMNPGGDYGKKELSPALSNRFTQIWVPAIEDEAELAAILHSRITGSDVRSAVATRLLAFWKFFRSYAGAARTALSVRDLLAWVGFVNAAAPRLGALAAYAHGAHLVLLDGIGLGVGMPLEAAATLRDACHRFLLKQLPAENQHDAAAAAGHLASLQLESAITNAPDTIAMDTADGTTNDAGPIGANKCPRVDEQMRDSPSMRAAQHANDAADVSERLNSNSTASTSMPDGMWGIPPFFVARGPQTSTKGGATFDFRAPTTARNAMRVLRALQLRKAVLLEGSPGVGKTSLVAALAKATGQRLVRINLSEQTDMMDLLGADLPVEGGAPGEFAWCDGPLLGALKAGLWVLLDELNLAGQSILEGLNAILDHRAEVFIPELGRTFRSPPSFRLFAAQNPLQEGGGRKGLPKSFLNRFTRVHIELLQPQDLTFIAGALHPRMPLPLIQRMVAFLGALHRGGNIERRFGGAGGPWEFNLRDLLRWCDLAEGAVPAPATAREGPPEDQAGSLEAAVLHSSRMLFVERLRTAADRQQALQLIQDCLGCPLPPHYRPSIAISPEVLQVGWAALPRASASQQASPSNGADTHYLQLLHSQKGLLESMAQCMQRAWMCILTGGPGSGKTSSVRLLARLCGRQLVEMALTSGTDTSDLLGGFEQLEPQRRIQEAADAVQALDAQGDKQQLELLAQLVAQLTAVLADMPSLQAGGLPERAGEVGRQVGLLQQALAAAQEDGKAGRFEWVDCALCRAIEQGQWVLLDNANMCNPTVLDRLNPLLEPDGALYINECGLRDGQPRIIKPHPGFRLFLAADPRHGEISRAMRNRGIELFILPDSTPQPASPPGLPTSVLPDTGQLAEQALAGKLSKLGIQPRVDQATEEPSAGTLPHDGRDQAVSDAEAVLIAAGVPGWVLPRAMAAAHEAIVSAARTAHWRVPTLREVGRWAGLTRELAERGWPLSLASSHAWLQVYISGETSVEAKAVAAEAFDRFCSDGTLRVAGLAHFKQQLQAALGPLGGQLGKAISATAAAAAAAVASQAGHPVVAQLLQLRTSLQGSLQMPAPLLGLQPIDLSLASPPLLTRLQRMASDGGNGGPAAAAGGRHWPSIKSLGAQYRAVRAATAHAAVLAAVLGATASVMRGDPSTASVLQQSYWRYSNPQVKARHKASHPAVDWVYPVLAGLSALEASVLGGQFGAGYLDALHDKVATMQDWRAALWHSTHGSLSTRASAAAQAVQPETLTFIWVQAQLLALCALTRVGAAGYEASTSGQTSPLARAGIHLPIEPPPELADAAPTIDPEATLQAAVLASLASDPRLRESLLEGASFFALSACQAGKAADEATLQQCQHILDLLRNRVQEHVDHVAAAVGSQSAEGSSASLDQSQANQAQQGRLPETLPGELMQYESCRRMQLALLPLQDLEHLMAQAPALADTTRQLLLLSAGQQPSEAMAALAPLLRQSLLRSQQGCVQNVADAVPVQLLLWLLDARQTADQAVLRQLPALVHEMWFRWHSGLWDNTLCSAIPTAQLAGPLLMYQARRSVLASALLTGPPTTVMDRNARALQLRLAACHIGRWGTRGGAPTAAAAAAATWRNLAALLAQIVQAHAPSLPSLAGQQALAEAVAWLLQRTALDAAAASDNSRDSEAVASIQALLSTSTHSMLAWVLLGALRLHLVLPPLGTDPAGKYALKRQHLLDIITHSVQPETQVRQALQELPIGADNSPRILALAERERELSAKAKLLKARMVPRPEPPQYGALHDELRRFTTSLGSVQRIQALLRGLQAGDARALQEATVWHRNADAWAQRLFTAFPLYRDLLQPVGLATLEIRSGFAMLASTRAGTAGSAGSTAAVASEAWFSHSGDSRPASAFAVSADHDSISTAIIGGRAKADKTEVLAAVVAELMAFPKQSLSSTSLSASVLGGRVGQALVAGIAAAAVPGASPQGAQIAAFSARLATLRAALHTAARCAETAGPCSAAAQHAQQLFGALLGVWEEVKAAEEKYAEQEAEFFRTKERSSTFLTEEEEAEADFKKRFPDHFAAFADVASMDEEGAHLEDDPRPQEPDAVSEAQLHSAAARGLLQGEILHDIVNLHERIYSGAAASTSDADPWQRNLERAYDLGASLLGAAKEPLPAWLDEAAATGHLMRVCTEQRRIAARATPAANTGKAGEMVVDMQQAAVEETALLQGPVTASRTRLLQLLEEWPDHPLLAQLLAICDRLLALDVTAPLKTSLTGLELLLARAQLWEETAARHVSLRAQLEGLAGLATRWRRLELAAWHHLLDQTAERHAAGAHRTWFHLYRILAGGQAAQAADGTVAEAPQLGDTALAIEQFLQSATLGEFERRLQMVCSFRRQLLVAAAADPAAAPLAAVLYNSHRYYGQFLPRVKQSIQDGMTPLEKHLQDFVKLAKWEDRGYYAMRVATEKAQRQLHKLTRKAEDLLKQPVAGVLAAAAKAMGFADLANPDEPEGQLAGHKARKQAEVRVLAAEAAEDARQWSSFCAAAAASLASPAASSQLPTSVASALRLDQASLYQNRMPQLVQRMQAILGDAVVSLGTGAPTVLGAAMFDELAGPAAERALALRGLTEKGARSRKKKALTDLLKALGAAGVLSLRSAVPAEERSVQSWFAQAPPDVQSSHILDEAVGDSGVSEATVAAAGVTWQKADAYFYRNMARLQRLWQAAQTPHQDLSLGEVTAASHLCEHLLYLQRRQRATLRTLCSQHATLRTLCSTLDSLATPAEDSLSGAMPPQALTKQWQEVQKAQLDRLVDLAADTSALLAAAGDVETATVRQKLLQEAASLADAHHSRLAASKEGLAHAPGDGIITPAAFAALVANFKVLSELHAQARTASSAQGYVSQVPGWGAYEDSLAAAASLAQGFDSEVQAWRAARQSADSSGQVDVAQAAGAWSAGLEQAISGMLLWAQNLHAEKPAQPDGAADGDAEDAASTHTIPELMGEAEYKLGTKRVEAICSQLQALLSQAASLADTAGPQGQEMVMGMVRLLGTLRPLLSMLRAGYQRLGLEYLALHKSVAKLGYVVSSLLGGVIQEGFCTAEETEGEGAGEGGGQFKESEGTGLGEGEGARDVSDQIEDEDQLLGSRQRDQPEPEKEDAGPKKPEDDSKGIEMQQDFEGTMHDLEPDPDADSDAPEAEEDAEKLDQEMGELGEQQEVVDERLWGDEDRKQEGQQTGQEKTEKNAPIQVEDKTDLEYQAGQEPDEEEQPDPRNQGKPQPDKQQAGKDDADVAGEDQDGDQDREQDQDHPDGEGPVNDDSEDKYEDRQFAAPQAPEAELDLPEDMDLDGAEGGEDEKEGPGEAEEEEGGGAEESGPFKEQPTPKEQPGPDGLQPDAPPEADAADEPEEAPEPGQDQAGGDQAEGDMEDEAAFAAPDAAQQQQAVPPEEEAPPAEDPELAAAHGSDQLEERPAAQDLPEAGPSGLPSAAAAPLPDQAMGAAQAGDQEEERAEGGGGEKQEMDPNMAPDLNAPQAPPQAQQGSFGAAEAGRRGAPLPSAEGAGPPPSQLPQAQQEANPYRSLGDALERWRARLAVTGDSNTPQAGEEEEAAAGGEDGAMEEEQPPQAAGEYEFVGQGEQREARETQALASATEDQAKAVEALDRSGGGGDEEMEDVVAEPEPEHAAPAEGAEDDIQGSEAAAKGAQAKAPGGPQAGLVDMDTDEPEGADADAAAGDGDRAAGDADKEEGPRETAPDSYVTAMLARTSLEGEPHPDQDQDQDQLAALVDGGLSSERKAELRQQLEERLRMAAEGGLPANASEAAAQYGREMWARCEALTAGLAGELTEQLRLILEPTLASRLAGDYRSGKRISMKKVIAYIASHFRKDKIWLRRTRPDKRKYQVVIAVDDSKSMAETGCGAFALEALTLITRAMSRLEVGELGVVSYGGTGSVQPLHPLEKPFTDADGTRVMAEMRFDQDNTIADRPMVELLTSLMAMLEAARHRSGAGGIGAGTQDLHQLVLIVADGRFHEKESLRRMVAEASSRRGIMLAFIILDNPASSLLDMQTVTFAAGKPHFAKYIDTFPFPYYIVLRDIAALPATLAGLLRQWFQLSAN
ncbi:hypothetical protein WJX72_010301 [[Myrmecia] bisecta]|uniref:Midasin n=1 Tax=[Myrmecia] bisecta TaxID=41462 RepID=A0AAW1PM47_9CHLO